MRTIEDDIAQAMEDLSPPGAKFVVLVTATFDDVDDHREIYGPFDSWKEAADWSTAPSWGEGIHAIVFPLLRPL